MLKPRCKYCGGKTQWRGKQIGNVLGITKRSKRYQCIDCGKWDSTPSRHDRPARILLLDIETLPGEYYAWSPDQQYLSPEFQIKDWSISCWAAKWLFEKNIMGEVVSPKEAIQRNDSSILQNIWKLMDEADIIITQNGIKFDIKRLNTRFAMNGYMPPSQYLNVDTLRTAKWKFDFTYNRLDELGQKFGIGKKLDMRFTDFKACAQGDAKALKKMLTYCKRDVAPLLEDVYLHMLPWIDNHPNLNIYTTHDSDVCRNCASTDLSWNTQYRTPQGLWIGWRCNACGAIGRGKGKENKIKNAPIT